ncbi:hypothetical protein PIB30_042777 [Stylosanthes scabra]|uniref:Uncharacterized protein n=1 Tax=Stylosanthes scabra TaxID=79078 RepID=A0ABU6YDP2_9FABA|nr:hypothetical protein [Stylosanthes scabra]
MPKKGQDSERQKTRGRGHANATENVSKKKGKQAEASRYGSLTRVNAFIAVLFHKWRASNLGSVPHICRELPTIVEEETGGLDEELLDSLEDLKQKLCRREDTLTVAINANASKTRSLRALLVQQGRALEALNAKLDALEGKGGSGSKESPTVVLLDDDGEGPAGEKSGEVSNIKTNSLFSILADVAGIISGDNSRVSYGGEAGRVRNPSQRRIEYVNFSAADMDILYSIKQRYIGCPFAFWSHNRTEMIVEECPQFLDLAFRPPPCMRFIGSELAIAAYIFANAGDETLVVNIYEFHDVYDFDAYLNLHLFWGLIGCVAVKCYIRTITVTVLAEGCGASCPVINMVVGMCNGSWENMGRWWLPTTFSQMIVCPEQFKQPTMDYVKHRYMGLADDIVKSICEAQDTQLRIGLMKEVGRYLESMLKDSGFWSNPETLRPQIGDFEPECPETGRQADGTCVSLRIMDCGVWVCEWMINSHLWQDYMLEDVNSITMMTIAVDLVTSQNNPLAEAISDRAVNFSDAEMLRNYRDQQQGKGKGKNPAGSSSQTI